MITFEAGLGWYTQYKKQSGRPLAIYADLNHLYVHA